MPVMFTHDNPDWIPVPWHREYHQLIAKAIAASRPASEQWFVTTYEPVEARVLRINFSLGMNAPHALTFQAAQSDADFAVLYRTVCQFLSSTWAGGIEAA